MSQPTIVLLHGLFGFRRAFGLEYFRGIKKLYQSMGLRVITPYVPLASNIQTQALALAKQLQHENTPLHFLAHSMGGLYARYYITHLNGHQKVKTLTTLSSPHRGTTAADFICQHFSLLKHIPAIHDLTREHMHHFNQQTPDMPQVHYRTYSASRPIPQLPWIVRDLTHRIQAKEGDNDALVSVVSSQWGEHIQTLYADHFELIGFNLWLNPFKKRQSFKYLHLYQDIGTWVLSYHKRNDTTSS